MTPEEIRRIGHVSSNQGVFDNCSKDQIIAKEAVAQFAEFNQNILKLIELLKKGSPSTFESVFGKSHGGF